MKEEYKNTETNSDNNSKQADAQKANKEKEASEESIPFKPQKSKEFHLFNRTSIVNIILTLRHLSVMLKSGLALEDALKVLSERAPDEKLKQTFTLVLEDVHAGKSLADSMKARKGVFSDIIISLIDVGEQGGTLEKNLIYLGDYLKQNYDLQKKVKNAMLYPIIVLMLTMVEMFGVIYFLLPKLDALFSSFKNPPEFTVFIINLTKFIRENILYIAIGLFITVFIFNLFINKTQLGRRIKDKFTIGFPIVKGLTKNSILTTFAKTLAILLESGIPLTRGIEITANTTENIYYRKVLLKANEDIKKGLTVAESLGKYEQFFPSTFTKIVEIGENTGTLDDNLEYLYVFYKEDLEEMSNNISTLIEPLLLIFIGVMIGLLAIIIIAPIYQLTGTINE